MRQLILSSMLAAALATPAFAAAKSAAKPAAEPAKLTLNLSLRDLSVRFMDFYDAARKPAPTPTPTPTPTTEAKAGDPPAQPAVPPAPVESEADRRWRLFKSRYNFTTQPDDASARAALEAAWPRYAAKADQIYVGFDGIKDEWTNVSNSVLTGIYISGDKPAPMRLVTYVGTFEGKVWSAQDGDKLNIYVPLEVGPEERDLPLARLLARDALPQAAVWGAHPRSLAEFIVSEGVIAHVQEHAVPGKSVENYLDLTTAQLDAVKANRKAAFSAILQSLKDGSPATLAEYSGPKLAEARYAGWLLVGDMLKSAGTADLIRQRQSDLVGVSAKTMVLINRAK